MHSILALGVPVGGEWLIIAMFGLLLFGKRLPEVGNSLGRTIIEFKKGLRGIEEEIERAASADTTPSQPMLTQSSTSVPATPAPTVEQQQESVPTTATTPEAH